MFSFRIAAFCLAAFAGNGNLYLFRVLLLAFLPFWVGFRVYHANHYYAAAKTHNKRSPGVCFGLILGKIRSLDTLLEDIFKIKGKEQALLMYKFIQDKINADNEDI